MNVRGERILVLGDSLSHVGPDVGPSIVDIADSTPVGSPGGVLAKQLLADGAQAVRVNAKVGRSARSFLLNEGGANLMARDAAEFHPTKVVVFLGTNDIDRGLSINALVLTADAMTQIRDGYRAMGAEVFALGPPIYPNVRYQAAAPTMLDTIRGVFGADHTIDIRPLTVGAARTGDGIHFTGAGAAVVGPKLAQALEAAPGTTIVAAAGMSTGAKIALGAFGVVSFIGLSWVALRVAKRVAMRPRQAASTWWHGPALKLGLDTARLLARRV